MSCNSPCSPKLYGQDRYDVENLARSIQDSKEAEAKNTPLYQAALKHLKTKQMVLNTIFKAKRAK
jgi:hypothetical protein